MSHHQQDLVRIFNNLFAHVEETILVSGGDEPLYLPQGESNPLNCLIFRHDYYASALHEVAHWCIAGKERRKLVDFGYWYAPDGRNAAEQMKFEQAEIKPQALEWLFSMAAGWRFQVSIDNLAVNNTSDAFTEKVHRQVMYYLQHGLPPRAEIFKQALIDFYQRK